MSQPLTLTPLSKQITAALGQDYEHVLIVMEKRTPDQTAKKEVQCQYVSPMERKLAWKTLRNFIEKTKDNPMFNPDLPA